MSEKYNKNGLIREIGTKYPDGYWNKIEYWTNQLVEAVNNNNLRGVDTAHRKLDYFICRYWNTAISHRD